MIILPFNLILLKPFVFISFWIKFLIIHYLKVIEWSLILRKILFEWTFIETFLSFTKTMLWLWNLRSFILKLKVIFVVFSHLKWTLASFKFFISLIHRWISFILIDIIILKMKIHFFVFIEDIWLSLFLVIKITILVLNEVPFMIGIHYESFVQALIFFLIKFLVIKTQKW